MKKNEANIVNSGDRICATLDCNGSRLASVEGMDFSCLEAVKRALLDIAGRFAGMAVLTVRNCTQGWLDVSALSMMRAPRLAVQPAMSRPMSGSQYLIPWAC